METLDDYCTLCKRLITSLEGLRGHYRSHHAPRDRNCCYGCEVEYDDCKKLQLHLSTCHKLEIGEISRATPIDPPARLQSHELKQLMAALVEEDDSIFVIQQSNYILGFDREKKIARFSLESITGGTMENVVERDGGREPFHPCKHLGGDQMTVAQIRALGLEAGHMVPVCTQRLNEDFFNESFSYANVVAMEEKTNSGMWKASETLASRLARIGCWDRIHVLSGTILSRKIPKKDYDGAGSPYTLEFRTQQAFSGSYYYVPVQLYKIMFLERLDGTKLMLGFLIPNDGSLGNIHAHRTSLAQIEELAGIRFTALARSYTPTTEIRGHRCTFGGCFEVYLQAADVLEHSKIHPIAKFRCRSCTDVFESEEERKEHEKGSHCFPCDVCGEVFDNKRSLYYHKSNRHEELKFVCEFANCGKAFQAKQDLEVHQVTHTKVKNFVCPDCGVAFTIQSSFLHHMRKVHGKVRQPSSALVQEVGAGQPNAKPGLGDFQVPKSPAQFARLVKKYACPQPGCASRFWTNRDLSEHMNSHKPFNCAKCTMGFKVKADLEKHEEMHRTAKYECEICGYATSNTCDMAAHKRRHAGDTPHMCTYCSKGFVKKAELIRHERVHTGEKPFVCLICGKSFARKATLTTHQKTHKTQGLSLPAAAAGTADVVSKTSKPAAATATSAIMQNFLARGRKDDDEDDDDVFKPERRSSKLKL